jgi:hypothetical protein
MSRRRAEHIAQPEVPCWHVTPLQVQGQAAWIPLQKQLHVRDCGVTMTLPTTALVATEQWGRMCWHQGLHTP